MLAKTLWPLRLSFLEHLVSPANNVVFLLLGLRSQCWNWLHWKTIFWGFWGGWTWKFEETDFYQKDPQYFPRRKSSKCFESKSSNILRIVFPKRVKIEDPQQILRIYPLSSKILRSIPNKEKPNVYWNATLSCPFMASNDANLYLVPILLWSPSGCWPRLGFVYPILFYRRASRFVVFLTKWQSGASLFCLVRIKMPMLIYTSKTERCCPFAVQRQQYIYIYML